MEAANSTLLRGMLFNWLPDTGPVTGKARLTGHLKDPAIQDIDITAGTPAGAMISARGQIGSIALASPMPVSGIEISLSIRSEKAEHLFANVKAKIPELDTMTAVLRLRGTGNRLVFENISVETTDPAGVEGRATGTFILEARENGTYAGIFDIDVNLTAPHLSNFAKILAARTLPELGPVKLFTHVTGTTDVMTLEDIIIEAGQKGDVYFAWRGHIGKLPLAGKEPASEIGIVSTFYAKRTSLLSPYAGFSVPDLGSLEGSSRIVARPEGYGSDDIIMVIGNREDYRLKASGSIDYVMRGTDVSFEGIDLSVSVRQLESAPLLASLGRETDMGRINGTFSVSGDLFDFALRDVQIGAVSPGGVSISAQGAVHHIRIHGEKHVQGVFADVSAQVPDMKTLNEITGMDLPDLGPFTLHAQVSNRMGGVTVEKIHLLAGENEYPSLLVDGRMRDVPGRQGMDFSGSFEAALRPWSMKYFGHDMPERNRIEGEVVLTGTVDALNVKGSAHLGETAIEVLIERSEGKERPRITAKISSPKVNLDDLGFSPDVTEEKGLQDKAPPSPPRKKIFGDSPLPFEKLHVTDISLGVEAGEVVGKDFILHDLVFDLTSDKGLLVLKKAGIQFAGGFVSAESTIDTRTERPDLTLKINAEDIDIARLFTYLRFPWIKSGHLNIAADLRSSGSSPREIASALQGELGMAIENGRIRQIADYLGADAIDFVTTAHKARKYQRLNCLALKFSFEDGIGTSDIIYSDTPEVRSYGKGTVNLRDESIDLVIQPKPKKGQIGGSSPVTLTGPLNRPSVRKLPFIEAARLFGEIFMPYAFLPARALGYVWYLMKDDKDEESPCLRSDD